MGLSIDEVLYDSKPQGSWEMLEESRIFWSFQIQSQVFPMPVKVMVHKVPHLKALVRMVTYKVSIGKGIAPLLHCKTSFRIVLILLRLEAYQPTINLPECSHKGGNW